MPANDQNKFPLFQHRNGQWAKKIGGKLIYFGKDRDAALQRFLNTKVTARKSAANRPNSPLFLHATGQWARKVNGKLFSFGKDREAALERWEQEKGSLERGEVRTAELTIKKLVCQFLFAQEQRVLSGELGERTWHDYARLCAWIMNVLGDGTEVAGLQPFDIGSLRAAFTTGEKRPDPAKIPKPTMFASQPIKPTKPRPRAKRQCSPVTLHGLITHARVLFNFAQENLDKRIKYGSQFDKPTAGTMRKARAERGELMFEREQIKALLATAKPQMRAMIYLGVNCGMGNTDCAELDLDRLDLDGGWLDYPRVKTGIPRRCPIWPETVDAIRAALEVRTAHNDESDARAVFITKYGYRWTPKTAGDPISAEIGKMLRKLKIARRGLGSYSLRRTFPTVAGEQVDREAIRTIGGWGKYANDMLARYEQRLPSDARLKAVSDHVRGWLMQSSPAQTEASGDGAQPSAA